MIDSMDTASKKYRRRNTPHTVECYDPVCIHWFKEPEGFRWFHVCKGAPDVSPTFMEPTKTASGLPQPTYAKAYELLNRHMNRCKGTGK